MDAATWELEGQVFGGKKETPPPANQPPKALSPEDIIRQHDIFANPGPGQVVRTLGSVFPPQQGASGPSPQAIPLAANDLEEAEIVRYEEQSPYQIDENYQSTGDELQDGSWGAEWGSEEGEPEPESEPEDHPQSVNQEAEPAWSGEPTWSQQQQYSEDEEEEEVDDADEEMSSTKALRAACATVITADSSMENKNYRVALPLYAKALKLFRDEEATANADFAHCLEKFGDCNYHRGNFEEALNAYREYDFLFSRVEFVPDQLKVVALLKLGKTSHKMKRFADSEAAYELAINISNATMPAVHPLVPLIFHSYVSMLRARGADQFKIDRLESDYEAKVKEGADESNVPPDLRDALNPWIEPDANEMENIVKSKQLQNRQQQNLKSSLIQESPSSLKRYTSKFNPVAVLIAIIGTSALVLVAAFIFLGTNLLDQTNQAGSHAGKTALARLIGNVYTSVDGLKTLEFKSNQMVIFTCGAKKVTIPFLVGGPEKNALAELKQSILGKKSCVFQEVKGGFEDPDGTILYSETSKDLKLVKKMRKLMKNANAFFKRNGQYPRKLEDFTEPVIDTAESPAKPKKIRFDVFQFEKYEGSVAYTQKLTEFSSGTSFFDEDKEHKAGSGLIECLSVVPFDYYHREEGMSFFIRAYGPKNHFISSSIPGQAFVLVSKNGRATSPISESAVKPIVIDAEKTTAHFLMKEQN